MDRDHLSPPLRGLGSCHFLGRNERRPNPFQCTLMSTNAAFHAQQEDRHHQYGSNRNTEEQHAIHGKASRTKCYKGR